MPQFGGKLAVEADRAGLPPAAGGEDADGAAAREYAESVHNRPRGANAKPAFRPSATIYFAGAPSDDGARVAALLTDARAKAPLSVAFAAPAPKYGSRRCGYAEYASVSDATEALMLANNLPIDHLALRLAYGSRGGGGRAREGERPPAGRSARSRSRSRSPRR